MKSNHKKDLRKLLDNNIDSIHSSSDPMALIRSLIEAYRFHSRAMKHTCHEIADEWMLDNKISPED